MKITSLFLCLLSLAFAFFSFPTNAGFSVGASRVVDLSGEGPYEVFPGKSWQFVGRVRPIGVGEGQTVVATATAVLGTNAGTTRASIAICHQRAGSDPVTPLVGDSHLNVAIDAVPRPYTVSAAANPQAGTLNVGFCIVNSGREVIGNNNYINGWAMTTD